jgi:hypothetical protein
MNEELQKAFLSLILEAKGAATEHMPEVIRQMILWAMICPIIPLATVITSGGLLWLLLKRKTFVDALEEGRPSALVLFITPAFCMVISFFIFILFAIDAFKAYITPYEYVRSVVMSAMTN